MEKWLRKVHPKRGFLHQQLGVPAGERIPTHILQAIVTAPVGSKIGGQTVTLLLKRRANFALNVRK